MQAWLLTVGREMPSHAFGPQDRQAPGVGIATLARRLYTLGDTGGQQSIHIWNKFYVPV